MHVLDLHTGDLGSSLEDGGLDRHLDRRARGGTTVTAALKAQMNSPEVVYTQILHTPGVGPEIGTNLVERLSDASFDVVGMKIVQGQQPRHDRIFGKAADELGFEPAHDPFETIAVHSDQEADQLLGSSSGQFVDRPELTEEPLDSLACLPGP